MSGIEAATQLWAAGDREGAFELLCGVWAKRQDFALAEVCEQLSEQLVRERRLALASSSAAEQHAALMVAAKAGDRVAVHALLPWLIHVARPKGRQRLAFLEPTDPVLLRTLAYWLVQRPELNELPEYLVAHRRWWLDMQHAWLRRDAPHEPDRYTRAAMEQLRLVPSRQSLNAVEAAALGRFCALVEAETAGVGARREALLEAVREHVDEDAHRVLLGDFLLSQDQHDPRGEFINLQLRACAEALPDSARARERELLDLQGFRWLGPLVHDCILPSVVFRRGFLAGVDLRWHSRELRADFGAPGHPIWATVERLNGGTWAIVQHPIMRSLRSLGCDPGCAAQLLSGPVRPRIEALSVSVPELHQFWPHQPRPGHDAVLALAHELFASLDALPNLRHVRMREGVASDPGAWRWIWQGPRAHLESVRLRIDGDQRPDLFRWIEQLRRDASRVELLLDYGVLCFTLLPADDYETVRVSHSIPRWRAPRSRSELLDFVASALGPSLGAGGLRRIEISGQFVELERLRELLAQRGDGAIELAAV